MSSLRRANSAHATLQNRTVLTLQRETLASSLFHFYEREDLLSLEGERRNCTLPSHSGGGTCKANINVEFVYKVKQKQDVLSVFTLATQ